MTTTITEEVKYLCSFAAWTSLLISKTNTFKSVLFLVEMQASVKPVKPDKSGQHVLRKDPYRNQRAVFICNYYKLLTKAGMVLRPSKKIKLKKVSRLDAY